MTRIERLREDWVEATAQLRSASILADTGKISREQLRVYIAAQARAAAAYFDEAAFHIQEQKPCPTPHIPETA